MAATTLNEADVDASVIQERKVAVVCAGDSHHAQAQNLRDSGVEVVVGLPDDSPALDAAYERGLQVLPVAEAVAWANVVMMQADGAAEIRMFERDIMAQLSPGDVLLVQDGANLHFGRITPPAHVAAGLVTPLGSENLVREQFVDGKGVPCLVAVAHDPQGSAREVALSYAAAIGGARAGIITASLQEVVESMQFGEHAVLAGGVLELVTAGFSTLVDAGHSPELAYLGCVRHLKLVADRLTVGGLAAANQALPGSVREGGAHVGARIIDAHVKDTLRTVLQEIHEGTVHPSNETTRPSNTEFDEAGARVRALMSWI